MEIIKYKENQIITGEEPRIYMVEDDAGGCEIFITLCKSKEEANREARDQWESLTPYEKQKHRVHVIYTKKTGEFYEDLGEYWAPDSYHSCTSDADDFDSANKLDYRVCGYDITIADSYDSITVVSYDKLNHLKDKFGGDGEAMLNEISKTITTTLPDLFSRHLESDVDNVIDSVINAAGYLIDDILNDTIWYYDFETCKYRRKIENQ